MNVDEAIQLIWDYHHMNHKLEKADAILILGSHDARVAEYAASLYHEGWAPLMVFSGNGIGHRADMLKTDFQGRPEAEYFAGIVEKNGVPREVMIIENKSNNTQQNFEFTRDLLKEKGIEVKKAIVVQKPYMERRAYATGKNFWPELDIIMTSPPMTFEEYASGDISKDDVISIMVGDLERIKEYPKKGFQIEQEIPEKVWQAFELLVAEGYTQHLIKE